MSETPLFKAIRAEIEQRRPRLLILDTLADLFGGDEITVAACGLRLGPEVRRIWRGRSTS